ncbi:hypothetical protein D9613_009382 [Agrocybe pediades]|uniref:Uncharacterized protein n=1 Tax=Agrocybe pediades TaxID=84607 RepID=A0A8H4R4M5_9AGAR|nr:hypothetical protein D9613_009382 [Agrocybe pediades]
MTRLVRNINSEGDARAKEFKEVNNLTWSSSIATGEDRNKPTEVPVPPPPPMEATGKSVPVLLYTFSQGRPPQNSELSLWQTMFAVCEQRSTYGIHCKEYESK